MHDMCLLVHMYVHDMCLLVHMYVHDMCLLVHIHIQQYSCKMVCGVWLRNMT